MSWRTPPMSLTITSVPANYTTGFTISGITGSYQIDWGDGTTDANTATHTYVAGGTYTILLYVSSTGRILTYNGMTSKTYLTSINAWGDLGGVTTLSNVGGPVLVAVPNNLPSSVTSLASAFANCTIFNGDISQWNVRNVTNMANMFNITGAFNQDIGKWNVSNVTDMTQVFREADAFNQDIGKWNTSKVTGMFGMFFGADAFNQDITKWNILKVTTIKYIFYYATNFNQNIGSWDISGAIVDQIFYSNQYLDRVNFSDMVIKWGALPYKRRLGDITILNGQMYTAAQAAATSLINDYGWYAPLTCPIPTPVLDVKYNQPRTRIYTNGSTILSYNPSLLGTYNSVVFTAVPALSTIGLTLNTATGVISGAPTVVSSPTVYTVTCSAYDAGNALLTDASFNLTFSVLDASISYAPSSYSFFKNTLVSPTITPTVTGGMIIESYSVSPALPTGLVFDLSYGIITGTPTDVSNTAVYTVTATDDTSAVYTTSLSLTIADISYAPISTYAYLSDVSINNINPTAFSYLYDSSFNFSPALPSGLAINTTTGVISGTPLTDVSLNTYNLTVRTISNYTKSFAFPIKVVDISYTSLSYAFLNNTTLNAIQPKNFTSLQDASLNFANGLPGGIVMDASGTITGTPRTGSYHTTYPLTIRTSNNFTPVYSKDIPFTITVSDISYANVAYQFLSDVSINTITPTSNYDASINFTSALPSGVTMDASGNINGTPIGDSAKGTYNLNISTTSNYSKSIPFTIDVVDISYAQTTYGFFKSVAITPVQPKNYTSLHDASLNFAGGLPGGLAMDASGTITGTPTTFTAPTSYPLTIRTTNQYTPVYSKTVPFTMGVILSPESLRTPMSLTLTSVPSDFSTGFTISGITGSYQIDWGDGITNTNTSTHTYVTGGTYTILLYVELTGQILTYGGMSNANYLTSINAWGDLGGVTTLSNVGGVALVAVPNNLPSTVTSLANAFHLCYSFNGDISQWNVGNVTTMATMFSNCTAFNGDISQWNVGNVTTMASMFNNCYVFNRSLIQWNVSKVTTMSNMFFSATAFNGDISHWNVSNVTTMNSMFKGAAAFNGDISRWNVGNVANMSQMFMNCTAFNGDLSQWNVSKVTDMINMFYNATAFNRDISRWNVSNVVIFEYMFYNASAFNQNLGSWNIRNASSMATMFYNNTAMTVLNISNMFIGWATLPPPLLNYVNMTVFSGRIYTSAQAAVTLLQNSYGWVIQLTSYIATPTLDINYNESRTRVYRLSTPIPSYVPSLTGTYDHVVFSSVPTLSTIGLSLDASGVISGAPTVLSSPTVYNVTCSAYDTGNTLLTDASFNLTFSVLLGNVYYSPSAYSFFRNMALSPTLTPTVYGGITIASYSVSPALPSGLAIDPSYGIISGTPTDASNTTVYTVTATDTTASPYSTSLSLTVADISYAQLTYEYLSDVSINIINPTILSYLYDASYNFSPALPSGLAINTSTGDISGTPLNYASLNTYNLTVRTTSNYSKTFAFPIKVVDISYTTVGYEFVSSVPLNAIQPKNYTSLQDASLNFANGLPDGLVMDASGTITGTPSVGSYPQTYPLTIRTSNNFTPVYSKTMPFTFGVADISYATVAYDFLADVLINPIQPFLNIDASLNFTTALPAGLTMDASGNINGTPSISVARTNYDLLISTFSNYSKTIPFTLSVSDVSYSNLNYEFLVDVSVNITTQTTNYDASFNFSPPLPAGLQIDSSGNINGKPLVDVSFSTYNLIVSTASNYSKTIPFNIGVVDISYTETNYGFIAGVELNTIQPKNYTSLQDASINFFSGLPAGLVMDVSGNISGTPPTGSYPLVYPLTITTSPNYTPTYSKTIPFTFGVADISYTQLEYEFLSDVSINTITPTLNYDASLNFFQPLPAGLTMDASGTISGTPTNYAVFNNYLLTISTFSNYTKFIPFIISVVDISFTQTSYEFVSNVFLDPIVPNNINSVQDASVNFYGGLPAGLTISSNGTISGQPTVGSSPQTYPLTITTSPNYTPTYSKTFPLTFGVADISYTQLGYEFLANVSINTISPSLNIDASLNFSPPLPAGLSMDASGTITGRAVSDAPRTIYNLTITTASNYSKTLPFNIGVVDISYAETTYEFVSNVSLNPIAPLSSTSLQDASLNFYGGLPNGLAIDASGNIIGTPTVGSSPQTYPLTISTSADYTPTYNKTFPFTFGVADISYTQLGYEFMAEIAINTINPTLNIDASLNFNPPLPAGLTMDASGTITGTVLTDVPRTIYNLTITTTSNYSKTLPFDIGVVDISYAQTIYEFLSDVSLNPITPLSSTSLQDASLNFYGGLPSGLAIDASGNIIGTPIGAAERSIYPLTIATSSNYSPTYSKQVPFSFGVVDISYTNIVYTFLADVLINNIIPRSYTDLYDASINFYGGLPTGLAMDASGNITGTPINIVQTTIFPLTISTSSNYSPTYNKTVPFTITVDDIIYTNLNYGFLNDISVNIQPNPLLTNLYDTSLNFSNALPSGLSMDTSGNITGTPNQPTAPTNNTLTLSIPGYSKTLPFNFTVSDISYVNVTYDFFASVPIRDISAINPTDIYGAILNFAAPAGLTMDLSGTIRGRPIYSNAQQEFDLTITTFSNYQKTIPFFITIANIYYNNIFYNFLSDVQINTIVPNVSNLNSATFSFNPALPNGLAIDYDGNISGTPINATAAALYTLAVTTPSDYTKQISFQFIISDISYATLNYGFLVNDFINVIHPNPLNTLYGATVAFDALPAGLTSDATGNISGNPLYAAAPTPYTLTITTSQFYEDIYTKSLIFTLTVSDISYTTLNYGFLSNITINDISSNSSASLYDASLNFTPPLPAGLTLDGSGNITGTPTTAVAPAIYELTITSASNSVKTIPFKMTVSDVSYDILDFGLIANIALNDISANVPNTLYDASLNFSPALPAGLRLDGSGNILGTPQNAVAPTQYNLTLTSLSNYTKVLPFHFTVSDISYVTLDYGFLQDITINDISANTPSTLYDASLNFTQPLPLGLSLDGSGNILGTPLETVAPSQYNLTLTSFSNYTKVLPFHMTVSDISYANLTYEFLADVLIRDISVNQPNTVYNASLNFNPPLPAGLIVDGSGTIYGKPQGAAAPAEYDLTLTTLSNYTKVLPFHLTVADLSYTTLTYGFLANQLIRDISATDAASLYGATFNFTPDLPTGLALDASGTITGTPIVTAAPAEYDLNISISGYHKILPFNLRVSDLSYAALTYDFLADVSINTIQPTVYNVLYDASVNVYPAFPNGLTIDASGNILGTPFGAAPPTTYTLTVTSLSNYTRNLPLNFTVSDLSYVGLTYDFLANVPIIEIQPTDQNSVYGATINFTPPLPDGLALDGSGNIRGSANNASDPAIYPLTISVPGYSKAINFALTVSDLSYAALDYIFLAETPIYPLTPSIFANLQTYTLTLDSAVENGLTFDPTTGIFTGTPLVLASEVDYQLTVSSPFNVYQKTMTLAFIVTDISYTDLSYNYLENNEFLYTPIALRGYNIAPNVYLPNTFGSLIFTPPLPNGLVIDLSYGVITGIPNIAAEAINYILAATTSSGYTRLIPITIQVEGFAYIINVPRPEYSFNLYAYVEIPLVLNVGGYSNFTITPALPGGLGLDTITGTIAGQIKLYPATGAYLFFITGFRNPSITIPIIINVINPYATPCAYLCPPPIFLTRQIDNMNTRAMRFSTIARNGLGQTRFITNSGTNINRTYSEPPRNKF